MSIETAASIGLGLLRNREDIAAGLRGLAGLAKDTGKGFAKIADKLNLDPGKLDKIADRVSNPANSQASESAQPGSTVQAMMTLGYFDADKSGTVSKEELQQGLQKMQESGAINHPGNKHIYQIGSKMLGGYDQLANMDSKAGIGYRDLLSLAGRDGMFAQISQTDWQALETPDA